MSKHRAVFEAIRCHARRRQNMQDSGKHQLVHTWACQGQCCLLHCIGTSLAACGERGWFATIAWKIVTPIVYASPVYCAGPFSVCCPCRRCFKGCRCMVCFDHIRFFIISPSRGVCSAASFVAPVFLNRRCRDEHITVAFKIIQISAVAWASTR